MNTKFLTPIQLWEDFNPVKEPLQLSYVFSECEEGYLRKGVYYTSETVDDGKARIYAEIVSLNDNKKKPVIIIIGPIENSIDLSLMKFVSSCGYIAAALDYSGTNSVNTTKYTGSLSYASYNEAINCLTMAKPSAKDSAFYVWAKAARRLITLIGEDYDIDKNNIGVLGIRHGSIIMWQLAAMDGRVKAGASLNGYESLQHKGKSRYIVNGTDEDEAFVNWRAAISSEAYARFVSCPIMVATSTNDGISSVDRIKDIMKLMPDNIKSNLIICPRLNNQVTDSSIASVRKWFNSYLKKSASLDNPTLRYDNEKGKLKVKVEPDMSRKIKSVELYYSYHELLSEYRNWHLLEIEEKDSEFITILNIFNADIRHFIFANVTYSDNLTLSTPIKSLIPSSLKIDEEKAIRQRIIYDTSLGIDSFSIESDNLVIDDDIPFIIKSSEGISGITTSEGDLVTYKVNDIRCYGEEDSILQLDANSKTERKITLEITLLSDNGPITYYAYDTIKGGEEWTKLSFEAQDFKTIDLHPLKNWSNIKKLKIKNADNVLFNNIIWV